MQLRQEIHLLLNNGIEMSLGMIVLKAEQKERIMTYCIYRTQSPDAFLENEARCILRHVTNRFISSAVITEVKAWVHE